MNDSYTISKYGNLKTLYCVQPAEHSFIMSDPLNIIGYFRLTSKSALNELQAQEGKSARKNLAGKAGISLQHLNDIFYGKKAGSEDARHRIAKALGYEYADFIEIGKKLHQGYSFQAAKQTIRNELQANKISDNLLKGIVAGWDDLEEEQKNTIFETFKECLYENWQHHDRIDNMKGSTAKIFEQIWKLQCEESGVDLPFGGSTLTLIKAEEMNKIDIFYEARNYVRQAQRSLGSSS